MAQPLYRTVIDTLVDRIASGDLPPGAMLPSEIQLGQELGVAQGTARKALMDLEARGLVRRVQGRGTFVTQRTTEDALFRFFRVRRPDGAMDTPVLISETVTERRAAPGERNRLAGTPEKVVEVTRLRRVGGATKVFETSVYSATRFPGLAGRAPLPNTLYVFLHQAYSCMILRADESLAAIAASAELAAALGVGTGAPVLQIERSAYDAKDELVELRRMTLATNDHRYFVSLTEGGPVR